MYGIDINQPLEYRGASFRYFAPHEHHVSRFCSDDVLVLVFGGVLRFEEDKKKYEISSGEWHIQHHDSYQTGEYESDSPKYLYIHFYGTWSDSERVLPSDGTFVISELTQAMTHMDNCAHNGSSLLEKNAAFFSVLSSLLHTNEHTYKNCFAEKITKLLLADIKNPPSLTELSEYSHMSKNQIIRVFKKEFGVTPYSYLNDVRLKRAARLLEVSSLSIATVAEECGFTEYTHFFKSFKKEFGISPTTWRTKKRKSPAQI